VASLMKSRRDPSAKAHAGTVIGTAKADRPEIRSSGHDKPRP